MGNYVGLGQCKKCGKDKIDMSGEIRCLFCEAPKNEPSGLVVKIDDPGDARLTQMLASSGVAIAKPFKKPEVVQQVVKIEKVESLTLEEKVNSACDILKSLPMPKDIKQFKAINKAIEAVQRIVGE